MATMTSLAQPALNNPRYYMNPHPSGPSPPDVYNHQPGAKNNSNNMGPPSSTSPANSVSPTTCNPNNPNARQLRQPRQPLYVPAALRPTGPSDTKSARPTDIPGRPRAPDTPPASKDSSFDSARADFAAIPGADSGIFFGSQGDDNLDAMRHGLSRAASESYSVEELGEVTGVPTTAHWKPDESAIACWICNQSFTWYFRRHHCRRCGNLVCDYHIKYNVPLDQNARYHPKGFVSKACKSCFDGWRVIKKLHHSRTSSIAESSNSSQGTAMPIPTTARASDDFRVGSMARSEGMVWSTF